MKCTTYKYLHYIVFMHPEKCTQHWIYDYNLHMDMNYEHEEWRMQNAECRMQDEEWRINEEDATIRLIIFLPFYTFSWVLSSLSFMFWVLSFEFWLWVEICELLACLTGICFKYRWMKTIMLFTLNLENFNWCNYINYAVTSCYLFIGFSVKLCNNFFFFIFNINVKLNYWIRHRETRKILKYRKYQASAILII